MRNRSPRLIVVAAARGRAGLLRTTALQAAAVLAFVSPVLVAQALVTPAMAQPAPGARPMGGVVVGGAASIGQTPATTTVAQSSQRAAIDWRSFDVGSGHAVQFLQPNSTAVVLNRVTGPDPSQIAGRISANGQVVITNQSGVVFHQGSSVDTAGLIVSAAGISTPNFMAGRMVFDIAPKPDAMVSNAGTITVKEAGLAALVAPRVANSGVITARMGRAVLAGAETHTVDLYGDGLLSIDVTGQVRQAPRGPDGQKVTALVTNTGTIVADGGSVVLTASAADGIVQTLVQAGGRLQANAANGRAGTVVVAGVGGSVRIEGRVAADGAQAGTVLATATDTVTVAAPARISASGAGGGGTVTIGNRSATRTVTIEPGATVAANAWGRGNGGQVRMLASGTTTFDGQVFARGGREGGDGGTAEVSGGTVAMAGRVDTGAAKGRTGTLLIDPTDVTISDHGGAGTVVTPASIEASNSSVTIQADNSIVVSSSVNLASPETAQVLTLNAGNFIRVDAGVTLAAGGGVTFQTAPGGVSLLGNVTARLRLSMTGAVTQGPGSVIDTTLIDGTVGSLALTSAANRIQSIGGNGRLVASSGDIAVTSPTLNVAGGYFAAGVVVQNGRSITLTANTLTFSPNGGATMSAPGGTIGLQPLTAGRAMEVTDGTPAADTLSVAVNSLNGLQSSSLVLGSATTGALNLNASTTSGTVDFGGVNRTLVANSGVGVTQTGPIETFTFSGTAPSINLSNGSNDIGIIGVVDTTGPFSLHTGDTLTVAGGIASVGAVNLSSGNTMTLAGNVNGLTVRLDSFNGDTLGSSGAIVQTAGIVSTGSLTGQGQSLTLGNANQVAGVGDFHTDRGFSLRTGGALALTGALLNDTGVVQLNAGGAITQAAGSALTTPTLTGTAGSAAFSSATNRVSTLNGFTTSLGDFALTTQLALTAGPPPVTLGGTISVPTGRSLAITADRVAFATGVALTAPSGTVAFAPLTAGLGVELTSGAATNGVLSLSQAGLNAVATGTLQVGSPTAGAITVGKAGETVDLTGRASALSLLSAAGVTQGAGAALVVPVLGATAASVALTGANRIGTLGAITTSGLANVNSALALSVAGPFAATGDATISSTGALTLAGAVSGANVNLSGGAGGIAQTAGAVATPGTLRLTTTGAVTQPGGTVTATTLTGNAGSLALTQAGNQIAALGPFAATGAFGLTDGRSLTISGAVGGTTTAIGVTGDLAINAALTGTDVTLNATGAITEGTGGRVSAASLAGSAGSAVLGQSNAVDTLRGFTSGAGFTLLNDRLLTVTGPVVGGTTVSLTGFSSFGFGDGLRIAGDITAPTVNLVGRASSLSGGSNGLLVQSAGRISGTTVSMTSDAGVSQTGGGITAGTLTVAGNTFTVLLDSATNQIGTLGAARAVGGLRVRDNQALTVTGPATDTARVDFDVAGALTLAGAVTAPIVGLGAGSVAQTGGALTATTLTGAVTGGVALNQAGNSIANLGAFSSIGSFSLVDGRPLTVAGAVQTTGPSPVLSLASDTIGLGTGGSLTAAGGTVILAPATPGAAFPLSSLVAGGATSAVFADTLQIGNAATGPIVIDGAFNLSGTNTVRFVSSGAVTETVTGAITGNALAAAAASVTLGGANRFTTLGDVTTAGAFVLANAQALNLVGTISAGTRVQLDVTGALTQTAGAILADTLAGSAGSVSLTSAGNRIANLGPFVTVGDFALTDGRSLTVIAPVDPGDVTITVNGDLVLNSTVTANTLTFIVTGTITEGAGGGVIATTLRGSAATARLDQSNTVGTLADFASTGGFLLRDSTALAVTGPVTDGASVTLSSLGPLTLSGAITAPSVALSTVRGDIVQRAGAITAATGLALNSAGAVSQTGGSIVAGAVGGSSGGATTLGQGANRIGILNAYSSVGGFSLRDGQPLAQAGALSDTVRIGLNVAGGLALGGTLAAPAIDLVAGGAVTQTGGSIATTTLTGAAGGAALNQGANAIANLGGFTTGGAFSLVDGQALAVTGAVAAGGSLSLASDAITLRPGGALSVPGGTVALSTRTPGATLALNSFVPPGTVAAVTADTLQVGNATTGAIAIGGAFDLAGVGTLNLVSGGTITETAAGRLGVRRLTASGTTIDLGGANAIGTLGDVTAGSFSLVNAVPITVAGTVRAAVLALQAPGSITLQDGLIASDAGTIAVTGLQGRLVQTGTTTVTPSSAGRGTLRLAVDAGSIGLNNLVGPNVNLTLAMGGGVATGALSVADLLVADQRGGATLTGSVAGRTGFDAAIASRITVFDPAYTLNGCAIASVSCVIVVTPVQPTPPPPPLIPVEPPLIPIEPPFVFVVFPSTIRPDIVAAQSFLRPDLFTIDLVTIDIARNPADPDFALPNISDRDY